MEDILHLESLIPTLRSLNFPVLHNLPESQRRYLLDRARLHDLTELNSAIHRQFREAHAGHKPHAGLDPSRASTGVVWTSERAGERGYWEHQEEWANLGQGAPEAGDGEMHFIFTSSAVLL